MHRRGVCVRGRPPAGAGLVVAAIGFLGGGGAAARAQGADEPAKDAPQQQSQPVDAAGKKLAAAHGLFQRGLYKLAAAEYVDFINANADHKEANTARYALGVCRYRLGEYDAAVGMLDQALRDPNFAQRDDALAVLGHCHLSQKHYDKALAAFDELLSKHPQSKHAEV